MAEFNFKRILKEANRGDLFLPVIQSYLHKQNFPDFTVKVHGVQNRPPDDWFHPSQHPLWGERQLYYYLTQPEGLIADRLDPLGVLAVTAGNFWHSFMEVCLMDAGLLTATEVPLVDEEVRSRGHMDGQTCDPEEGFEFKTMNSMKMGKIAEGPASSKEVQASWRALVPVYAAQADEYMRMAGLKRQRFIVMNTAYPFPMREICLDYDEKSALSVRDKYLRVRQAVADQRPPQACCNPGSAEAKACFARAVCPVGQM